MNCTAKTRNLKFLNNYSSIDTNFTVPIITAASQHYQTITAMRQIVLSSTNTRYLSGLDALSTGPFPRQ